MIYYYTYFLVSWLVLGIGIGIGMKDRESVNKQIIGILFMLPLIGRVLEWW